MAAARRRRVGEPRDDDRRHDAGAGRRRRPSATGVGSRLVGGRAGLGTAFALGAIFAVGWTPCIGVILGGILTMAADLRRQGSRARCCSSATRSVSGIPFIVIAAFYDRAPAARPAPRPPRPHRVAHRRAARRRDRARDDLRLLSSCRATSGSCSICMTRPRPSRPLRTEPPPPRRGAHRAVHRPPARVGAWRRRGRRRRRSRSSTRPIAPGPGRGRRRPLPARDPVPRRRRRSRASSPATWRPSSP